MHKTDERIARLRKSRADIARTENVYLVDEAYAEAAERYSGRPVCVQFARGFENALRSRKIVIQDDDILAGFLFRYTYNVNFPMRVSGGFDPADRPSLNMDVYREVKEIREAGFAGEQELAELEEFAFGAENGLIKHWHSGHVLPSYARLLRRGWAGLRAEAVESLGSCSTEEEQATVESFMIAIDACSMYIRRYRDEAGKLLEAAMAGKGEGAGTDRIRELRRMRDALDHIAEEPAGSFYEAVQLVYLVHEMMYCENVPSAVSLGRVDQYLYPYYVKDLETGAITHEEAADLIDAMWLKVSGYRKAYQNLAVGGCGPDGKNACNELTRMCLDTAARLRTDQPSIAFRWPEDIDDETWDSVLSLIREGMGFPAMMYDPCYMSALKDAGVSEEDVWDYAFVGCVEPVASGKENGYTELFRLNIPRILKLLLNKGADVETGRVYEMKHKVDPGNIERYDQLEEIFFDELKYWFEKMIRCLTHMQHLYAVKYPLPCISVLTEDCIARKRDINNGGARYDHTGFNLCGVANAADALTAVRRVVFDGGAATLAEYTQAVNANFEGYEDLREYAVRRAEKFGNDCELPDKIAARIAELAADTAEKHTTYTGGTFRLGMYSVEDHSSLGMLTGATHDGRKAGTALCNSSGAAQGMDVSGPTAMINSVTRFPMRRSGNGMVLDIKFTPAVIAGETGGKALRALIETYYRKGGMEIQVSAVSRETLLDAQKNPDQHGDLIVRVSGFSAYFTALNPVTQNEIIARTEN